MSAEAPTIDVTVNGEHRAVPSGATIAQVLAAVRAPNEGVAVERNGRIVRRGEHASTPVEAGDRIEIVTFVGGG